jgi:RecB family exonuclease
MLQKAEYIFEKHLAEISDLISVETMPEVDIKANFEEVRLSGKLDAVVINREEGTAIVRDYKTGTHSSKKWNNYKNQLYLYKLLLDQSPERLPKGVALTGAELVYINPGEENIITIKLDYKEDEYQAFKQLLKQTWHEIMELGNN